MSGGPGIHFALLAGTPSLFLHDGHGHGHDSAGAQLTTVHVCMHHMTYASHLIARA